MKAKLLTAALFAAIIFTNCSKSDSSAKPQLTFKGINGNLFPQNSIMSFSLSYNDMQGNILGQLYVQKITLNCLSSKYSTYLPIPGSVPTQKNAKGEIDLTYVYNGVQYDASGNPYPIMSGSSCQVQNQQDDSCIFRFALIDGNNKTSDTVSSPIIVLKN